MITIKIADIIADVDLRYPENEKIFTEYISEGKAAFTAKCGENEILAELAVSDIPVPAYCENACICRNVAEKMLDYDRFLFHSAVIEVGGKAVAFAAKSGIGKSTHARLWLKNFSDCRVLNGDKPFFSCDGEGFTVYGSPWQGKEGLGYNGKAELSGICFLKRAETNSVRRMSPEEAFGKTFLQVSFPTVLKHKVKITELLHTLSCKVPCYELCCNKDDDAAITARRAIGL